MRLFWTLQVCIGSAAIVGSIALSHGCTSTAGGGAGGGAGADTDTDTDSCYPSTSTDDTCLGGGPCCDVENCAYTHCKSECWGSCDFHGLDPGCPECLEVACPAEYAACP